MQPIVLQGTGLGLGVVRSLGLMNIPSILIYCQEFEIARASKYVSKTYRCPTWSSHEAVKHFLINRRHELEGGMLIPTDDRQVETLARYKGELSKYYTVPVPDAGVVKSFLDKKETYHIAEKAGIDIPRTFYPESKREALANVQALTYPLMLKPRSRDAFSAAFKRKLFIVEDEADLSSKLDRCFSHKIDIMMTEIIHGSDSQLYEYDFYVDKSGEVIAGLGHVKLRQDPPGFGVGRVIKTHVNDEVAELTRKFLKHIPGYFGPGQMEFKFDARDGKYKLIEMNGRLSLQNELFARAGVNFPLLYFREWSGSNLPEIGGYAENYYWIDVYKDLKQLLSERVRENFSYLEYLKPYFQKRTFCIESLTDPKPMFLFWLQKAGRLVGFRAKKR